MTLSPPPPSIVGIELGEGFVLHTYDDGSVWRVTFERDRRTERLEPVRVRVR